MLNRRTLFVVGAGASNEFGFPLGTKLVAEIRELCQMEPDKYGNLQPKGKIFDLIRSQPKTDWEIIEPDFGAAQKLFVALSGPVFSIDNFLAAHHQDANLIRVAKLAIASIISSYENSSALNRKGRISYRNLSIPEESWVFRFCNYLFLKHDVADLGAIFDNSTFVIFNYDRCFQQSIAASLAKYFLLDDTAAAELVGKIRVLHPYGNLGSDFGRHGHWNEFGTHEFNSIFQQATAIKTFMESTDSNVVSSIQEATEWAEAIVFLGFGFIEQNLELIWPMGKEIERKSIYGTAYNFSSANLDVIVRDLAKRISTFELIKLDRDSRAHEFIDNHWRAILG